MPQALEIDHEPVKIVALSLGVREAARQYGLSEETVMSWSKREGWLAARETVETARDALRERQGLPAVDRNGSDILRGLGAKTRLNHAKVADKIADKLSQSDADELLMQMPSVLMAGKHAALVAGNWSTQQGTSLRLDMLAGTIEMRSEGAPGDEFDIPEA